MLQKPTNYLHLLQGLDLTIEEKEKVIAAIMRVSERLLDKHYGLGGGSEN